MMLRSIGFYLSAPFILLGYTALLAVALAISTSIVVVKGAIYALTFIVDPDPDPRSP